MIEQPEQVIVISKHPNKPEAPNTVVIPSVIGVPEEIARLVEQQRSYSTGKTVSILIRGDKGIGKTEVIAKTARPPILIHSFDPRGTIHLEKEIREGRVIVDRTFEAEDARSPQAYVKWERIFDQYMQRDIFSRFGTYFLDSLTFWLTAAQNHVATLTSAVKGTPLAADGQLEIKGWGVLTHMLQYMVQLCNSLPCDFVLSAHSRLYQDQSSGMMLEGIAVPPSLQIPIPSLFSEYYYMVVDSNGKPNSLGIKPRKFLVYNTGRSIAGTRIGRGKFSMYMDADISKLLKTAGWEWEDKPLIQQTIN